MQNSRMLINKTANNVMPECLLVKGIKNKITLPQSLPSREGKDPSPLAGEGQGEGYSPFNNNIKGVSLVEVMIALVILLFVFLGLLQTSLLSIDVNVRNDVRDEAVRMSSNLMTQERSKPYSEVATTSYPATSINIRSFAIPVTSQCTVTTLSSGTTESKQVTIDVAYSYRGEGFTHSLNSIVRP